MKVSENTLLILISNVNIHLWNPLFQTEILLKRIYSIQIL